MMPRKRKSKQKHPKIKELPFSYSRIQKTGSISKTLSSLTLKKACKYHHQSSASQTFSWQQNCRYTSE
jgi:hypothetical protein